MKLRITVEGKAYDVDVEVLNEGQAAPNNAPAPAAPSPAPAAPAPTPAPAAPAPAASGGGEGQCAAPIAGNVTKVNVKAGDSVSENDVLIVLEAMKMESNIASPQSGTVKTVHVQPGDSVTQGQVLVEFA